VTPYLVDTSALARYANPAVAGRLQTLTAANQLRICPPVALEIGVTARSRTEHQQALSGLRGFPWVDVTGAAWERALDLQLALAGRGWHRAVKLPDLVIAATAAVHGLAVLHYDRDYDLVAEVTGQACEWIVPRGAIT
jgi:hypothetical protein